MGRVILHIGAGKTGTSSLQSAFAKGRDRLFSAGITYPEHSSFAAAREEQITSGNARDLARFLCDGDDAALDRALKQISGAQTSMVLYSSEYCEWFSVNYMKRFRDEIANGGRVIYCVYYVRSIVDYLLSAYIQHVKREALTQSFEEWVAVTPHVPFDCVERLHDALRVEEFTIKSYDHVRGTLVREFCETILNLREALPESRALINRSLSMTEVDIMLRFNRLSKDPSQGQRVSDFLIYADPDWRPSQQISLSAFRVIEQRFSGTLEKINRYLPTTPIHMNLDVEIVQKDNPSVSDRVKNSIVALSLHNQQSIIFNNWALRRELDEVKVAINEIKALLASGTSGSD